MAATSEQQTRQTGPHRAAAIGLLAAAAVAGMLVPAAGGGSGAALGTGSAAPHSTSTAVPDGFPASTPPSLPSIAGLPSASTPGGHTRAAHDLTGCDRTCAPTAHWSRYRFGSHVASIRAFWLVDRTGDRRARSALQELVDRWNRDVRGRQRAGEDIPLIAYYLDSAHAGQCSPDPANAAAWNLPGYSVLLVCGQRVLDSMGRAYVLPGPYHWGSGAIPWITVDVNDRYCNGGPMNHQQMVAAFAHELGHTMGLDHRSGVTLMDRGASGVCAESWFDAHDRDALGAIYRHPAD